MERAEKSVDVMYGEGDLAEAEIFQGGFINFGFWPELPKAIPIGKDQRIDASKQLYREVVKRLSLKPADQVLEVGCGRGLGCALVSAEFEPASVTGIDATPQQIERAGRLNASLVLAQKARFARGTAEKIPLTDQSMNHLYSVEAAQHFESVPDFLSEAFRILRPGGKISLTTFFASNAGALPELRKALPTIDQNIDRIMPIVEFLADMSRAGFWRIEHESIGARVFEGFDRWMGQTSFKDSWGRNWLKSFQNGRLDYFIISANKPS